MFFDNLYNTLSLSVSKQNAGLLSHVSHNHTGEGRFCNGVKVWMVLIILSLLLGRGGVILLATSDF